MTTAHEMRERAAKVAVGLAGNRQAECEHLAVEDPETGVRECSLEVRGRDCLCQERIEQAEEIAAAIRAIPVDDEPAPAAEADVKGFK